MTEITEIQEARYGWKESAGVFWLKETVHTRGETLVCTRGIYLHSCTNIFKLNYFHNDGRRSSQHEMPMCTPDYK